MGYSFYSAGGPSAYGRTYNVDDKSLSRQETSTASQEKNVTRSGGKTETFFAPSDARKGSWLREQFKGACKTVKSAASYCQQQCSASLRVADSWVASQWHLQSAKWTQSAQNWAQQWSTPPFVWGLPTQQYHVIQYRPTPYLEIQHWQPAWPQWLPQHQVPKAHGTTQHTFWGAHSAPSSGSGQYASRPHQSGTASWSYAPHRPAASSSQNSTRQDHHTFRGAHSAPSSGSGRYASQPHQSGTASWSYAPRRPAASSSQNSTQQDAAQLRRTLESVNRNIAQSHNYAVLPTARFTNLRTAIHTAVKADTKPGQPTRLLPANHLRVGGKSVAIGCQYPQMDDPRRGTTDRTDYFKMLAANRTSVVVALASDEDVGFLDPQPHTYFKEGQREYRDGVVVTSKKTGTCNIKGLKVDSYTLTISQPNKETIEVPVVHAKNWKDHSTQNAKTLIGLANHVKQVATPTRGLFVPTNSSADPARGEPVLHCRAGVGRTGTLAAVLAMKSNPELSVEQIVTDLRYSRSEMMVQTDEQLRTVEEVAARLGNPVLASADRHGHPAAAAAA